MSFSQGSSYFTEISSPTGSLKLVASEDSLLGVFPAENSKALLRWPLAKAIKIQQHPILMRTATQLGEYFSKKREAFDLPLQMHGTPFQRSAWMQLTRIPYGHTISYAQQAERLGDRKKARAVGAANAKNPLLIVVPCHRVVAKSGELSGFAGGIAMKRFLLLLEQAL